MTETNDTGNSEKSGFTLNNLPLTCVAALLTLLMLITPDKNLLAWLTLILGPLLVLDGLYLGMIARSIEPHASKLLLAGGILPILGMYVASFGALFSLGIPFGYYFVVALLVAVQIVLVVFEVKS
ncbi:MAG: hypothetical protein ACXAE3_12065 [Candidatus Kariarchaeaceae archaeon]|jgi:hypothetical protein